MKNEICEICKFDLNEFEKEDGLKTCLSCEACLEDNRISQQEAYGEDDFEDKWKDFEDDLIWS